MENRNREIEEIEKFVETEGLEDMETTGYTTIFVGPPDPKDVGEVQKKFEESEKRFASGIIFCKGESECRKFLKTDNENAEVNTPVPVSQL